MPTYEYACTACGHRLEAVQSFTDDPLTECPDCGEALRKVYGAVGIVLKGSGFYKTDSRAASAGNGSGKKSADSSGSDGGRQRQLGQQQLGQRFVTQEGARLRQGRQRVRDLRQEQLEQGRRAGLELGELNAQSPLSAISAIARV